MKTLLLILMTAVCCLGQTTGPAKPVRPVHPFHHGGGMVMKRAVINTPFSTTLPALAGETGCALTVLGGPKLSQPPGWKLTGNVFSATPTAVGFYRLKISCTKPNPVDQGIMLNVTKTAPVKPTPAPAPVSIPLN